MKEILAEKDEDKIFSDSCEIEEDLTQNTRVSFELHEIIGDDRESEFAENDDEDVYVAVGKDDSSMDALIWALKNTVKLSSTLYLIHVFPEVRHIPTLLGKIPRSQVNKEHVEVYLNQERLNRRELMLKFLHLCAAHNVKADAHLIESDSISKAILDLIPVLRIRTLVLGTSKSNLRKLKRGTGRGQYIQENTSSFCKVVVVCEGKVVEDEKLMKPCSPLEEKIARSRSIKKFDQRYNYTSCSCFSRRSA